MLSIFLEETILQLYQIKTCPYFVLVHFLNFLEVPGLFQSFSLALWKVQPPVFQWDLVNSVGCERCQWRGKDLERRNHVSKWLISLKGHKRKLEVLLNEVPVCYLYVGNDSCKSHGWPCRIFKYLQENIHNHWPMSLVFWKMSMMFCSRSYSFHLFCDFLRIATIRCDLMQIKQTDKYL